MGDRDLVRSGTEGGDRVVFEALLVIIISKCEFYWNSMGDRMVNTDGTHAIESVLMSIV